MTGLAWPSSSQRAEKHLPVQYSSGSFEIALSQKRTLFQPEQSGSEIPCPSDFSFGFYTFDRPMAGLVAEKFGEPGKYTVI